METLFRQCVGIDVAKSTFVASICRYLSNGKYEYVMAETFKNEQAASLPGDISRGKRSSMPQPKTRPDSPVPSLQGPCDRSLKSEVPCGSCLSWR